MVIRKVEKEVMERRKAAFSAHATARSRVYSKSRYAILHFPLIKV